MARIAKFPPITGVGYDRHGKMAPTYFPPAPPLPPGPLVPTGHWIHGPMQPFSAKYTTGKYSWGKNTTEGMGDILWQHDWGPPQLHFPVTIPYVTPSILLNSAAASVRYWLPSFSVQENVDGAPMAKSAAGGSGSPVAICMPIYIIPGEDCWDKGCVVSYNFVSSVLVQQFSTRWVAFNLGDFFAGVIGWAGDAASAAILSYFGGKLMKGVVDNMLFGALANTFLGYLVSWLPAYVGVPGVIGATLFGFIKYMTTPYATGSGGPKGGFFGFLAGGLAAPVAWAFGKTATAVGEELGSKPSDLPGAAPPVPSATPPPTSAPPPSPSSTSPGDPPQ